MASFNGRFFDGGYSGLSSGRNYIDEQIRNTEKQIPFIKDIEFNCCSYDELIIPNNSIIYCDIPYKDTKQYDISKNFDYSKFWNWCRNISEKHQVYISEYNAPDDFKCVWEKELVNSMNQKNTHRPIEKLFTFS